VRTPLIVKYGGGRGATTEREKRAKDVSRKRVAFRQYILVERHGLLPAEPPLGLSQTRPGGPLRRRLCRRSLRFRLEILPSQDR